MIVKTKVSHRPPGARGVRLDNKPTVSVVVASCCDSDVLAQCLASLESQATHHRAEIVVARAGQHVELEDLGQRFPGVQWVLAEPQADVPLLRGLGLAAAQGDIVALTEDHAVPGPGWLGHLLSRDADKGATNSWAAYFAGHEPGLAAVREVAHGSVLPA